MAMTDTDRMLVQTGRALLAADARASSALIDRTIGPIEAEFRSTRIKSLSDKLAASALDGITDLGLMQAARLRAIAQMCWIVEDRQSDSFAAGRWHDLGQLLWQAAHDLAVLVEGENENESA